jgi:hypothetical protein
MAHANATKHTLAWRKKNKAKYNEYQKLLVKKLYEYKRFSEILRKIDDTLFS